MDGNCECPAEFGFRSDTKLVKKALHMILPRWLVSGWVLFGITLASATASEFDPSHPLLGRVLSKYVTNACVDYAGLKASPTDLEHYLSAVAQVPETAFRSWPEKDQLAFLINLYNATTLQLIVDHYPVTSIRKIGSLLKGPWKQDVVHVWGKLLTLDQLEHEIIRPRYSEPRIHFALVCAAKGCPPLREEPYTGAKLEAQLTDQARRFLGTTSKNRLDTPRRTLYLSPIFKWYNDDFTRKSGSLVKFLLPCWPALAETGDDVGKFRVEFTEYDWSLNAFPPASP